MQKGALVYDDPNKNSPAYTADIQPLDVIVSIDGQQINKDASLTELIQQYRPGDEVSLEILRDGKVIVKEITLSVLLD